ncbi:MAG: helicase-related protein, partial [Flammeovirgaceae bacterium]|nr:helicase-related protein [Flammeovirgaceae bacterium]MDW8288258.1 helicase-related protein [Flammeovirgaceae bacterium]
VGDKIPRHRFLFFLVDILYARTEADFKRGNFRVKGDTVDIFPAYADFAYRLIFWGDQIEEITRFDPETGKKISQETAIAIFPANLFVTSKDVMHQAIREIQDDLVARIKYFENERRYLEAQRIKERTEFDLEMIRELGYCSGVENYSRYFDRRKPGQRPFCLLDYFPDDYLIVIDESHVTIPQIRAMWGGDRARKISLVDYGFRLPSALDNRPLTFNEFESLMGQTIYVSATPGDYELIKTDGEVVEQIIRPTGLLDPEIIVRPTANQIDDLMNEIDSTVQAGDRVLVTTLTKRMAEELTAYLHKYGVKTKYIHSDVKTLDRVEILRELRLGKFDVLVGVNLLREGLDLPEVALVAIMDADKEGFLRSERSLIQTIGRAARNANGRVIMYADSITESMQSAINETNRRRKVQAAYNDKHGIVPVTVRKSKDEILSQTAVADVKKSTKTYVEEETSLEFIKNEPILQRMSIEQLDKLILLVKKAMERAAEEMEYMKAAQFRDEMYALQKLREEKLSNKK